MQTYEVHVAVAAVLNAAGQVLVAKRNHAAHQGGKWEFPGGKLELGESVETALRRELLEEVGLEPLVSRPLIKIRYQYPDKCVVLDTWLVTDYYGVAVGREGQPVAWKFPYELCPEQFPSANAPIIHSLRLPDRCFITPDLYGSYADYLSLVESVLKQGVKLIQFRSHQLSESEYCVVAMMLQELCKQYRAELILNSALRVFQQMDASGLHLTRWRMLEYTERPAELVGKWLSVACHSEAEIQHAIRIGADFVFVSPVRHTRSHVDAEAGGWEMLQRCCEASQVPVYALGGMRTADIAMAQMQGAQGIAAIRAFIE